MLVLSEFHRGPSGDALTALLGAAGFGPAVVAQSAPQSNTVALLSRVGAEPILLGLPPEEAHRVVAARVGDLTVAGVYFAQSHAKRPLFDWLLSRPAALAPLAVLMGDFNTGLHRLDEEGATFHCAAEFAALSTSGWADAWRQLHGGRREASWLSTAGNPFRLDHAVVSDELSHRVVAAEFNHSTRPKLTDHSALTLDLH